MKRALEITTALGAIAIVGGLAWATPSPSWIIVIGFGVMIVLAENFDVQIHSGNVSITPGSMLMMAAIAVLAEQSASSAIVGGAYVAAFSGLYLPHIKSKDAGIVAFNCAQYALSAAAAAIVYTSIGGSGGLTRLVAATGASIAFGAVNTGLVLPYVAAKQGERMRVVWADMLPTIPNCFAWDLLGLLIGLVCAELSALAIVLLVLPMGIGRWTFRSFNRVKEAHDASVQLFIRLIEAKDPYTAGHTERVAKYSLYVGEELDLPANRLEHLRQSALMHDVGKLAVPSSLLNKPGKLTEEEFDVVKRHNSAGIDILGRIDFMRGMAVTASDKHGRFEHRDNDAELPAELVLEAHIVAVADAFDAMTSTRSYRRALSQAVAFEELHNNAGTQFNPMCVDALIAALERRGEQYGDGFEVDAHQFAVPPPEAGVGSAGLGDLEEVAR